MHSLRYAYINFAKRLMLVETPRITVTAPSSSSGKTLASMGIIYGLRNMGYDVQPFKVGPDFIDPSYLGAVAGKHALNLDLWIMGRSGLLRAFGEGCAGSDACVIEGVMGYLDGAHTETDRFFGSTYRVSRMLHSNVIAVIDASRTAQTALAIALGIARFSGGRVGIILNKVAGERHVEYVRRAIEGRRDVTLVGYVLEDEGLKLEERRLGLVPTAERRADYVAIAKKASENISMDAVLGLMSKAPVKVEPRPPMRGESARIAVAFDEAFNFYYWDSLTALEKMGAQVEFFSPVNDVPPKDAQGIIVGGGFPELFADRLERSNRVASYLRSASADGIPILAECGGLMYLSKGIYEGEKLYRWVGIFDAKVKVSNRLKIGYSELEAKEDNLISSAGQRLRGHEFHYSDLVEVARDQKMIMRVMRGVGVDGQSDGLSSYNALGTYSHFHLGSNLRAARRFLEACAKADKR